MTVDRLKEHIIELRDSLKQMYKRVADSVSKSRDAKRHATDKRQRRINLDKGDFLVVASDRTISQSYNPNGLNRTKLSRSFLTGSSLFVI